MKQGKILKIIWISELKDEQNDNKKNIGMFKKVLNDMKTVC